MKTLFLFLKQQKFFILLLLILILIPCFLLCSMGPNIPYIPYFFLFSLFFLKMAIFDENTLQNRLRPAVLKELQAEKKRSPSKQEIFNRILFHIRSRDLSLLFSVIGVVIIGIVYQKF